MPRPSATGAETRDRVLALAAELMKEKGYAGTSLREIAERLGVSKAALYYHFRSKDELVAALVAPALTAFDAFLDDAEGRKLPPDQLVDGAIALAFNAAGATAVFDDPDLRPGGTHDLGFGERRNRLARLLAGPRASREHQLRAYAALGAVEALVAAAPTVGASTKPPPSTQAALSQLAELARDVALSVLARTPDQHADS